MLLSVLERTSILVTIEYSSLKAEAEILVSYGGEQYNPEYGDNKFSFVILKKSVDEITYKYDPNAERGNVVKVLVRE